MTEDRNNNPVLVGIIVFLILVIGIIATIYFLSRTQVPTEEANQTTENIQVNIQEQNAQNAQEPIPTNEQTPRRQETVIRQETQQPEANQQSNQTQNNNVQPSDQNKTMQNNQGNEHNS
jgi:uncharacterized protein HemX